RAVPTCSTLARSSVFRGDGTSDLLWRDTSGNNVGWQMGGASPVTISLPNVPTSYTMAGIGDFNGDGKSDIIWRDTSGNNVEWQLGPGGRPPTLNPPPVTT